MNPVTKNLVQFGVLNPLAQIGPQSQNHLRNYHVSFILNDSIPASQNNSSPEHYGCMGAAVGGCLIPALLLFAALASGDAGGPLFWPIAAFFFGTIGFIIGRLTRRTICTERSSPSSQVMGENFNDRQLLRSLAKDLGALLEAASNFGQNSTEWQILASQLREHLGGIYAPIYPQVCHDIEHYLDDSDIRQRDIDYQTDQESAIKASIALWIADTP